ncbi:BTAD domain-containing putative transcriptional regulator [Lentzea sp. NPDC004789]
MTVEFRVLGTVEVRVDGRELMMGHARQLCVLVALLHDVGRPVPVDRILHRVWGDDLPHRERNALYGYLSRLRRGLADAGEVTVTRQRAGYVLSADADTLDLHRFRSLIAEARSSDDGRAAELFARALALWRGTPFAGLSTRWIDGLRTTLEDERFSAVLDRNDVALKLGRESEVLAEMIEETIAHPLDERLAGQVIQALHRCGRHAEAERHYAQLRRRLADELGVDPGPQVREIHERPVTGSPAASGTRQNLAATPVPRQLPAHTPYFVGRRTELAGLDRERQTAGRGPVVAVVTGAAGVGKTTLAVHWAHRVQDAFPDGQMYVNLKGFDLDGRALLPSDALRGFLTAFGVSPDQAPAELDALAAMFRSLLSTRRVLVVLDNARDEEQVRALLPGVGSSMVIVTSRHRLAGLVAREGARSILVRTLSYQESRELLVLHLGRRRVDAEAQVVDELIAGSGCLPLALAMIAARATMEPGFPLRALTDELTNEQSRLDTFDDDDPQISFRAAISVSCQRLRPPAARVFRLLATHPGPDVSVSATASLAAITLRSAGSAIEELWRVHLIEQHRPGRYLFHDLIRAYAAEQSRLDDSAAERGQALHRLLDHYLHTATSAAMLLRPMRERIQLVALVRGTLPETMKDYRQAWQWFEAEAPVLQALITVAAGSGFDAHVWEISWTLADYFDRKGRWHDWITAGRAALAAGLRLADLGAQASAHRGLGQAFTMLRSFGAAHTHLISAMALEAERGNLVGQAEIHRDLALMNDAQGKFTVAMEHGEQALEIFRTCGHAAGEAAALNQVGWSHCRLGNHRRALLLCEQALARHRELHEWAGQAVTWDSLGYVHHHMGKSARAVQCYTRALTLYRDVGDLFEIAATLARLADAYVAQMELGAARRALSDALAIFDDLHHPDAADVRRKLRGLLDPAQT